MKELLAFLMFVILFTSCKENEIEKLYVGEYYDGNKLVLIINDDNTGEAFSSRHIKEGKFDWHVTLGRDGKISELKSIESDSPIRRYYILGSVISPNYPQNSLFTARYDDKKKGYVYQEIADKK